MIITADSGAASCGTSGYFKRTVTFEGYRCTRSHKNTCKVVNCRQNIISNKSYSRICSGKHLNG